MKRAVARCGMANVDYTTYITHIRGTMSGVSKMGSYSIDLLAGSVGISNSTSSSTVVGTIRGTNCNTSLGNGRGGSPSTRSSLGSARAPGVEGELVTSLVILTILVCFSVKRVVLK